MFAITFMCIALFDELLFRMRCRQLWREAREAAERLIEVFEDSELASCPFVCIERKNNSSTKEEIDGKRWALDSFTITNSRSGFSTSRIPTNGISTCWMLEMVMRNATVRVIILWVVDGNTKS